MGRVCHKAVWLFKPGFADGFVWREALEGFESASEVIGGDEVREVLPKLVVAFIM